MADKASKCQHRDSSIVRAYYDRNGAHRVKHAYAYCGSREDLAVDVYGLAFCGQHRNDGDYGADAYQDIDLDAVLDELLGRG